MTDPSVSLSGAGNFSASGASVTYGGINQGSVLSVISTTTAINSGDSLSVSFDVTQLQKDTDFGWAVTDGTSVWGYLTFDFGIAAINGAFNGLDGGTNINFGTGGSASGLPGVGNSGTITFDYTFGAAGTTVALSGDYYDSYTSASFVDPTVYNFGQNVSILMLDGGDGVGVYQLDSINSSAITAVPEPSGALLASAGLGLLALRRKRQTA